MNFSFLCLGVWARWEITSTLGLIDLIVQQQQKDGDTHGLDE